MKAGDVLHLPDWWGGHFNFVLEVLDDGSVVLCNFTERKRYSDMTCIVKIDEHECIKKESVAYFAKAYVCKPGPGIEALERSASPKPPLSPELLARLRQGALESPHTPEGLRELLIAQKK
jgi:hypothetical protein